MDNDTSLGTQYNRVLLPEAYFFRRFRNPSGGEARIADASSLQFIIEELVSFAATQIAIDNQSNFPLAKAIDILPTKLRKRVKVIDEDGHVARARNSIFIPLANEVGLEYDGEEYDWDKWEDLDENEAYFPWVQWALGGLYLELYRFLLGLEYELEIEINIKAWESALTLLRSEFRSSEARSLLAFLHGIVTTYRRIETSSLVFRSNASQDLTYLLHELIEDETYKALSSQAHSLGFSYRLQRAKQMISRLAKQLAMKKRFRDVVALGNIGLKTATGLSGPNAEVYRSLLGEKSYLPPIVPLKLAVANARKTWATIRPEFIPFNSSHTRTGLCDNFDVYNEIWDDD